MAEFPRKPNAPGEQLIAYTCMYEAGTVEFASKPVDSASPVSRAGQPLQMGKT